MRMARACAAPTARSQIHHQSESSKHNPDMERRMERERPFAKLGEMRENLLRRQATIFTCVCGAAYEREEVVSRSPGSQNCIVCGSAIACWSGSRAVFMRRVH